MEAVHQAILLKQGITSENKFDQYVAQGKLGKGSFGVVVLAQHRFSKVKVAIKVVDKSKIVRHFTTHGQMFQELEVLKLCTYGQCQSVLPLIEHFEDTHYLYIVTKFMPGGDLLNYLMHQ